MKFLCAFVLFGLIALNYGLTEEEEWKQYKVNGCYEAMCFILLTSLSFSSFRLSSTSNIIPLKKSSASRSSRALSREIKSRMKSLQRAKRRGKRDWINLAIGRKKRRSVLMVFQPFHRHHHLHWKYEFSPINMTQLHSIKLMDCPQFPPDITQSPSLFPFPNRKTRKANFSNDG